MPVFFWIIFISPSIHPGLKNKKGEDNKILRKNRLIIVCIFLA